MSLVSQQQLAQNQLQLKQLDEQRQRQVEQTKSFQSNRSSTQELLQNFRQKEQEKLTKRDPSDPLAILIPTGANPTDILSSRFNSWRNIISCLVHYLREIVSVHEEISRQQIRLHHAITFPFVTQGLDGDYYQPVRVNPSSNNSSHKDGNNDSLQNDEFELAQKFFLPLGNGSIQDLPTVLYQYHSNSALLAQATVKELNGSIIPRLDDLKRDLLLKIKEIKSLQSDFKNQVNKYQQETKAELSNYIQSIETSKHSPSELQPKNDPYLLKLTLDRLIKRKLTEENYLHEAFVNLQTSGKELEKVVYIEVQTALTVYAKLLGQQAQNVFDNLISKLDSGILTKDPAFEWDSFIAKDSKEFIDLNLPMRHFSEIHYNYQNDPLTFEIRSGFLERKSKFLKSYSKGWYVLTSTFIHEFKSSDRKRDPIPIMSLALEDCQIAEHSRKDEKNPNSYHKFVLHAKQNGLLSKGHNWVFRAESYNLMIKWYNDLKKLTSLPSPTARSTLAWERKKQERINSIASSSLASSNARNRRTTHLSNITDQSSYHRGQSTSRNASLTNQSLNTMLSLPKNANNRISLLEQQLPQQRPVSSPPPSSLPVVPQQQAFLVNNHRLPDDAGLVSIPFEISQGEKSARIPDIGQHQAQSSTIAADETTNSGLANGTLNDNEQVEVDEHDYKVLANSQRNKKLVNESANANNDDSLLTLESNTKDGYVETGDDIGALSFSDGSKKETQM